MRDGNVKYKGVRERDGGDGGEVEEREERRRSSDC